MAAVPELLTERLRLRGFTAEDFPPLAEFWADPLTAYFVGGVCGPEDSWRRLAAMVGHWSLRGYGMWALEERATGAFLGYCGLWNPEGWPEREVGWGLLARHQGRGFVTEAARRARDHAYQDLGWTTLVSCIALDNHASIKVATGLGAVKERETVNRGWPIGVFRHPGP